MNGYIAIYKGKHLELHAASKWAAVEQARAALKVPKSKYGLLVVELAEKDGQQVTHLPLF